MKLRLLLLAIPFMLFNCSDAKSEDNNVASIVGTWKITNVYNGTNDIGVFGCDALYKLTFSEDSYVNNSAIDNTGTYYCNLLPPNAYKWFKISETTYECRHIESGEVIFIASINNGIMTQVYTESEISYKLRRI